MTGSRVDWQAVRSFVHRLAAGVEHTGLPVAGTPEWCALADCDPRKVLAVLAAGSRWALEQELDQIEDQYTARKAAAIAVAQARDWARVAQRIRGRDAAYIERRAS